MLKSVLLKIGCCWVACVVMGSFGPPAWSWQEPSVERPALPSDTLPPLDLLRDPPLGFASLPAVPADNPLTLAKAQLGRRLFFDPILSGDGTVSCASCHLPEHGLAAPQRQAIGIRGQRTRRNSPSLFNVAWGRTFFWDGRAASLEEQALIPIASPQELGSDLDTVLSRLRQHKDYPRWFREAFTEPPPHGESDSAAITELNLARAIASFERTLVRANTAVDRFHAAEYSALNPAARQGLWIFESRGNCWQCHAGENFSDEQFHNTGVSFGTPDRDPGRFEATGLETDRFKFKTPSLRGVLDTAPYMHDGRLATLEDVVEFYSQGGSPQDPTLDSKLKPLNLSAADKHNLVEYLKALSQ